jgi:hypothetical protein
MKTAILLLVVGLILALVVPIYAREIFSGAGIQLPQFFWSKTPPLSLSFSVPVLLRVIGLIFVVLSIIRFIMIRGSHTS